MSKSLERIAAAMYLAVLLTVISFLWNASVAWVGTGEIPVGYLALLALVCGGTTALTGNDVRAAMVFVLPGALAPLSMWMTLIPAGLIIVWRIGRRVVMLAQADGTAPRRPRMGFWRTLQAWVGWSATR